ncbi:MAG: transposase [Deltaproteobacteria bacterium]|nr:transposase [Deltaproteobacteria bacterium]
MILHGEWLDYTLQRFSLEFLPLYSPDLNPVERLWKLTCRLARHNRYFPTLQDIATVS